MTVPISNVSISWSDSSNTYTGFGINVYATGYSSDSNLLNLKVNETSKFLINHSGNVNCSNINCFDLNISNRLVTTFIETKNTDAETINVDVIKVSTINVATINIANSDLIQLLNQSGSDASMIYNHANSAFEQANTARTQANDAYTQANTLNITQVRLEQTFNTTGAAPYFPVRAWVLFTAAIPPVILSSGNIQSVTRVGVGVYTITFQTAMPTSSYAVSGSSIDVNDNIITFSTLNTIDCKVTVFDNAGGTQDQGKVSAIFIC